MLPTIRIDSHAGSVVVMDLFGMGSVLLKAETHGGRDFPPASPANPSPFRSVAR